MGAALRFGPRDLADPIVLMTVGGSLKERHVVGVDGSPSGEGSQRGLYLRVLEQAAGPPMPETLPCEKWLLEHCWAFGEMAVSPGTTDTGAVQAPSSGSPS